MTFRAVVLGLLGAAFLGVFTYFNDSVMAQTPMVGNNLPISVYGSLIIFLLLINPFLRKLALSAKELAVILALTLAAAGLAGSGLMRGFTTSLMLPHHFVRTSTSWQSEKVLELAPKGMLADIEGNEDVALNGFVRGIGSGRGIPSLSNVPWAAWKGTLMFWVPLTLALFIGLIGLSVVAHRQWADYEHLPYPLATFTAALLPEEGKPQSSIFRNKLFWIGMGAVLLLYVNNYAVKWWPRQLIEVPTNFSFNQLRELFPNFARGGARLSFKAYFTVIGFAYLLASDVSFSIGISQYLWALINGMLLGYGISIAGMGHYGLEPRTFLNFGAYLGAIIALLYTGRHYYSRVFREALFLPVAQRVEGASLWGARVFIVGAALFALNLIHIGLDWQLAVLYTALTFALFIVIGRIIAETGMFFVQVYWYPGLIIWGLLGSRAVGPAPMLLMLFVTVILSIDPREALMPFMINSLKLLEKSKLKVGKPAIYCALAVVLALGLAIPANLAYQYHYGSGSRGGWATQTVPKLPFNETVRAKQRLEAQGSLEQANSVSGWQRFTHMSPDKPCLMAFVIGLIVFLLFAGARLRWQWWPLHPIVFLVWNRYANDAFSSSFLAGWFIKVMVTKYGGARVYQKVKPLMFGLIAGELLGGVLPMITGTIYYFATGLPPKVFQILPG